MGAFRSPQNVQTEFDLAPRLLKHFWGDSRYRFGNPGLQGGNVRDFLCIDSVFYITPEKKNLKG